MENRGIDALDRNYRTGKIYSDNLCFFRALALHNGCHPKNLERDAKHFYERYREFCPEKKKFFGVKLKELIDLEHLYEVNIFVYALEPTKQDGEENEDDEPNDTKPEIAAELIHRSLCHYPSTLYLNLYQRHFSYIKDLKKYTKSYCCSRCGKFWKHVGMLHRHERTCEAKVHYTFPGGAYKTPPTIFELLEDEGFTIPPHLKYFPYRATFDFECMFNRQTGLNNTEKLTWNAKHIPLSVSVSSNVPEYDQPKCFVSDGDSKRLVKEMVEYLVKISEESCRLMKQEFSFLFEAIDQKLEEIKQKSEQQTGESGTDVSVQEDSDDEGEDLMETDDEEEDIESETEEDRAFLDDEVESEQGASFYRALDRERENQSDDEEYVDDKPEANHPEPQKKKVHPLKKLRERFEEYLEELPVLGFNSGKYDLNAVKEFLFPVLVQNEEVQFTIKRNNNFMCLKTDHLRFLDVTNFLAPGFSYAKFLKAYECPQTKGFFPYEWMDSLDKLDHPSLPPHDAFFSTLKNENITEQEYQYCQQVWSDNNMQTFKDFLIWYNNLDVQPFCDALEKMCAFWKDKNIDMLRQGISIPGVTLTYLFTTLESGIFFSLFDEKNKDLYTLFKKKYGRRPQHHLPPIS